MSLCAWGLTWENQWVREGKRKSKAEKPTVQGWLRYPQLPSNVGSCTNGKTVLEGEIGSTYLKSIKYLIFNSVIPFMEIYSRKTILPHVPQ